MQDTLERLRDALASRYTLQREIGRGGMATVYLSVEKHPKRRVAIKVLDPAVSSALGRKRFLREVEIVRDLDHPRIVPILEAGEADGLLYFVMPYVEGETVRHRLTRRGPFRLAGALDIARAVAMGLAHAHGKGIVHRDIKPENILLPGGQAMIADFGIAKALDRVGAETLTRTGHAIGTPRYMSPEQAAGQTIDGRVDLFSLGCILYEMIFNSLPVRRGRLTSEAVAKLDTLPPATKAVITKALAFDADERFPDADALAEALDTAREELIGVPGATFDERARLKRRLVLASVILATVFLLALLFRQPPIPPLPDRPAILVVPSPPGQGVSVDPGLSAAVAGDVIYRLSSLRTLRVISNLTAQRVWSMARLPRTIGAELGIDVILSVGIEPLADAGGELRFSVKPAMYTRDMERRIWSREFIVADTNLTAAPSRVVREVATALNLSLSEGEQEQLDGRVTNELDAFVAFYSGELLLGSVSPSDLARAIELLEAATEKQSNLTEAYAAIARAHVRMHWVGADPSARRLTLGRQALERAAALGPDNPRVRLARGDFLFFGQRDFSTSHREYATALIDRPADGELIGRLGSTQLRRGEWGDAVRNLGRAARHDPLNARRLEEVGLAL